MDENFYLFCLKHFGEIMNFILIIFFFFRFSSKLLAADKAAKIRSVVDAVRAGIMIIIAFIFLGIGFW